MVLVLVELLGQQSVFRRERRESLSAEKFLFLKQFPLARIEAKRWKRIGSWWLLAILEALPFISATKICQCLKTLLMEIYCQTGAPEQSQQGEEELLGDAGDTEQC